MELAETVTAILKHAPGEPLCDACLAFACSVSVSDTRAVTERLAVADSQFEWGSGCVSCRPPVASVVYRARPPKCAHCSQPVEPQIESVAIEGDLFHAACLQRLMADKTIRLSRALSRRSRESSAEGSGCVSRDRRPQPGSASRLASPEVEVVIPARHLMRELSAVI